MEKVFTGCLVLITLSRLDLAEFQLG